MKRYVLITCALSLPLSACTVGPDYVRPQLDAPANFANVSSMPAGQSDAELADWWRQFDDPVLDQLVAQALTGNLDMQIASSRIEEARFRLAETQAGAMPQVGLTASAGRTDVSENGGLSSLAGAFGGGSSGAASGGGTSAGSGLPGSGFNSFSAGFDASWEPDLFGGKRRAREAAQGDLEATQWSQRDTQLRLTAEVARGYFALREMQARRDLAEQLVDVRRAEMETIRAQVEHDLAPGSALTQPGTQLEQAKAQQAEAEGGVKAQRAALAVLLGTTVQHLPTALDAVEDSENVVPIVIPPGLPSELLQRRPDVRAAERSLAAATARIGVARADRFPHISLTGIVELVSTGLGNLVSANSLQTLAQGQAGVPLLDFGRGAAREGSAREQAQQAGLAYQQSVLGAFADVEQALATLEAERTRNAAMRSQLAQSLSAQAAARTRFNTGLTNFTPLGQAQTSVLAAHQALAESDFALRQAEIGLFKALGGGWS